MMKRNSGIPNIRVNWKDRNEVARDEFVGEFTSIFLDRKNIPKTQKMVRILRTFTGPQSPRIPTHSKIACSQKHKIPYQNPYILYKNLKNTNLSQITPNTTKILKSHQTPPRHSNHTKDSQNSYVSPHSSQNIWVGQDHPKIVGRQIFGQGMPFKKKGPFKKKKT